MCCEIGEVTERLENDLCDVGEVKEGLENEL